MTLSSARAYSSVISVVMPVFNCSSVIYDSLNRLRKSDDINFEIIVVDDGSTDNTADIAAEVLRGAQGCVIRCRHRGPGAARNSGVRAAKGDYILFLDSDVFCDHDTLFKMMSVMLDVGADCLGVRVSAFSPKTVYEKFFDMQYHITYGITEGYVYALPTACFLVKKDAFLRAGCFNESFVYPAGEDYDLCRRLIAINDKAIFYAPSICVWHRHPCGISALLRRSFLYSQEAVKVQKLGGMPRSEILKSLLGHFLFLFYSLAFLYSFPPKLRFISILYEFYSFLGRCRGGFFYYFLHKG